MWAHGRGSSLSSFLSWKGLHGTEEKRRRRGRKIEREGGRDRRLFKSITLSNCQCCRRKEKRIEGPGEGGDGGVDLVLWFILLLGELNLSQLASKQIYLERETKTWVRLVWPDQAILIQLARVGAGCRSPTHLPSMWCWLSLSPSHTHTHTHILAHHARADPFRTAWFISPRRMSVWQLSVI